MTNDLIQSGTLLIAPPSVQAGVWQKSVILVTEHHERGSLGLMLNKRSNLSIKDFSTQCNIELDIPGHVYIGGPVNQKSFCMLHSNDWSSSNTMQVDQRFSVSSTPTMLEDLANGSRPMFYRLFVGLCGWAPTQLLNEFEGRPPRRRRRSFHHWRPKPFGRSCRRPGQRPAAHQLRLGRCRQSQRRFRSCPAW